MQVEVAADVEAAEHEERLRIFGGDGKFVRTIMTVASHRPAASFRNCVRKLGLGAGFCADAA